MTNNIKIIAIALLLIGAFFGENIVENIQNYIPLADNEKVEIPTPSIEYKTLVQGIQNTKIDKKDANQIRDFFWQLSQVVKSDPGFIKTTGQFREFNVTAGGLNFAGLALKNKYPNLGEEIDGVIITAMGKENIPLTSEKRNSLSKTLQAIAWSVQ